VLARTVTEAAQRFGDRSAVVAPSGWAMSYRELDQWSDECAVGLDRLGLGEGDLMAVILPSCPEYLVLTVAAAKLGAVFAGVNHRLTSAERQAVLSAAEPELVVASPDLAPQAGRLGEVLSISPSEGDTAPLECLRVLGAHPGPLDDDVDRPVAVVFTSGTTGRPKGAVFGGRQIDFICGVDTHHRWADPYAPALAGLSATSLTHLGPTTKLAGNLHHGGTTFLLDRWRADTALEMTSRHRMPMLSGIPTQIALMLRSPLLDELDLSSVRAIVIGGGPATPELVRRARERFGAALSVRYACTEAGIGVGTALDAPPEDAEVSVGRPHPGVELTIRDDTGRVRPDGEVGEVCLRSPAVMSGYHRDPEATAAAFWPDGAVRTGDLGHVDELGRLRLAGRVREMYVRGGENVFPMEIEAVLAEHPDVADVAVVPRADDVMGEVGVAVVVARNGGPAPTLDGLLDFARGRLAHHKLPVEVRIVDALPLTSMEKLDRTALREMVAR